MYLPMRYWVLAFAVLGYVAPQVSQTLSVEFEAVELKSPGSPGGPTGQRRSGSRADFVNYSLLELVAVAHQVKDYRVVGAATLKESRVDIVAKVPPSATSEQLRLMLRNFLISELGLKVHHELRQLHYYSVSIDKDGLKMKTSGPPPKTDQTVAKTTGPTGPTRPKEDSAGFPVIPEFYTQGRRFSALGNGKASVRGRQQSIAEVAKYLSSQLDYDVVDRTGLTGDYDFLLNWFSDKYRNLARSLTGAPGGPAGAPDADELDSGPTLPEALRRQLGLRLDLVEGPLDVIVVDHLEVRIAK